MDKRKSINDVHVTDAMTAAGVLALTKYISADCLRVYSDEDIVTSVFQAMVLAATCESDQQASQSSP